MMRRVCGLSLYGLFLLAALPAALRAQEAETVTGHVSANGLPVRGAKVRIGALDMETTTNPDGFFSMIVRASNVRGQTVTLTASYLRFAPQSVDIELRGGSVTRDFNLTLAGGATTPTPTPGNRPRPSDPAPSVLSPSFPPSGETPRSAPTLFTPLSRAGIPIVAAAVDSSILTDLAGQTDLATALAGRLAGLDVRGATILGGSSSMIARGPKSIFGLTQPLVVVNGILIDNSNITTASQRSGTGGFDYGSSIGDLNLEDIASVSLLTGPAAAFRFGGRGANGVLVVTTKSARGLNGFEVAVSQQVTSESILRLPTYQNKYGQGLGGKFAFFDGKGGGVNDNADQSWGPALDGSPVVQASLVEAGRADVRSFLPVPNSVSDYFQSGRTITTNAAITKGSESGQFRIALSNRLANGETPGNSTTRQTAVFSGSRQTSARMSVTGDLQLYHDNAQNRPGTGFDESNPVSLFAHMPRSVDATFYASHLRDASGSELSWNYAGHNNAYFAALANTNKDDRSRLIGGASATYALSSWISATARAGTDHLSETRNLTVASGWMGGFPYYAGRGDFSSGGFEQDDISSSQTTVDLTLRAAPASTGPLSTVFSGGVGRRSDALDITYLGADKLVDTTTPQPVLSTASSATNVVFGGFESRIRDYTTLNVGARAEFATLPSGNSTSTLYPSVHGSIDLTRMDAENKGTGKVGSFIVRGGWSRSGNDVTAATLQRIGLATGSAGIANISGPETTAGFEAGTSVRMFANRLGLDATYYSDRSENLIVSTAAAIANTATLSNKGIEAGVSLVPIRLDNGVEWSVGLTYGKNTNVVESLAGGASAVNLAPAFGGVSAQARTGSSLGTLVGYGFLRDPSGGFVLRSGHPVADSIAGPIVLGESAPSWIGGLSSSIRISGVELSFLVDTHHGGKVFSASNMVGAVSGVLEETSVRPDTGLLIAGTDYATGKPNTAHVTTEDYYRALGTIGERWVYDASYVKLREARASFTLPLAFIEAVRAQSIRMSIVGRNLAYWAKAPNIDPETVLSTSSYRGAEMGQLPSARSVGFQLSFTP
ncbi:MAG: TonB-dependent outer membrane protein SusC/RagA [Gemmatimonadetes bacterium]|nr:TonB-dependent outer membrane protein SusC/RagA [Gemmatimonadota bacterium]